MIWLIIAKLLALPGIVDRLIARAKRTPYTHITGPDGSLYMERYWLFNPYPGNSDGDGRRWAWLPSVRLHRIMREDFDRGAMHDHPWNARTIILRGWYAERRLDAPNEREIEYFRRAGDTARLNFGEFHQITVVPLGGVWTFFIVGRKRGTWGFRVDGVKVPWRTYLGLEVKE
jgi:hypothetical protein